MISVFRRIYTFFTFLFIFFSAYSQENAILYGRVVDENGTGIFLANITAKGTVFGIMTDKDGYYELAIPSGKSFDIVYSCMGFETQVINITSGAAGQRIEKNIQMNVHLTTLDEVSVTGRHDRSSNLIRIDIKELEHIPNTSGGIETILKTLPGISSGNELSSQYSVRGGNFDENLVYVNDIEIFRPMLIRAGQQEGLSFINPDLVSSVRFSAGGYDASYGDKMSSVLDVSYKKPSDSQGSVSISALGGSAHYEDVALNGRLAYVAGIRYKSSRYLLTSLDTKGEYSPSFLDFQTFITYDATSRLEFSFLGNIAQNKFNFVPETRETFFGTFNNPLRMTIYYDGNEVDRFDTYLGAFTASYQVNHNLNLKIIGSAFRNSESETFDHIGQYFLDELDRRTESETFGDSIRNIGIGGFQTHARNYLDIDVLAISHVGTLDLPNNRMKWGATVQTESVADRLSEWEMIDSTGYSLPYSDTDVFLYEVINAQNSLVSNRVTGYFMNTYNFYLDSTEFFLTAGIRGNYWDFSNQFVLSPRASLSITPNWEKDILFHLSSGFYYQPPFYREMRDKYGTINDDIKAQKSIHVVLGGDYIFRAWSRPFKFTTEVYYKHFNNLIPYIVRNVKTEYAARNMATGYATGIDFKINGEFVPGTDSWASLSFLNTREKITDRHVVDGDGNSLNTGYYPRPTDQIMNFGLYFQDYFPNNPSYKVHLYFLYGSRLPVTAPYSDRYDETFRMSPYRRVDIGFSKVLKEQYKELGERNPLRHFKNVWIGAEIYNLFGVNNTISYQWLKTVDNAQAESGWYAVPNFLTSRRFNIRLTMRF